MIQPSPDTPTPSLAERLAPPSSRRSPTARRLAAYLAENPAQALASSAAELANRLGSSDATIIRSVQALGFEGMADLRQALARELSDGLTPADNLRRTLAETGPESAAAIALVLDAHAEALDELRSADGRGRIAEAVAALAPAGRVVIFGMGPSAPLARYVALMLTRHGRDAATLDATGFGLADQLMGLTSGDALLVLAYGQPYREVQATMAEGRRLGLPVVLVTDAPDTALARRADVTAPAKRGRTGGVALHGATLALLEAIVLGLAACDRVASVRALDRLNLLRTEVSGVPTPKGTRTPRT